MSKIVWCLPDSLEQRAMRLESQMQGLDLESLAGQSRAPEASSSTYRNGEYPNFVRIQDGLAVVHINDVILRHAYSFFGYTFGYGADTAMNALSKLRTDNSVSRIVLCIDSPGGDSYASAAIADAVAKLNEKKPVHAYIGGDGCSGAYWIACAARSITANGMSMVGSIGCYILAYDESERLTKAGVRPVMIRSAPNKGIGGDAITEGQESRLQGLVDSIAGEFFGVVAKARGVSMDDADLWGDGGTWTAKDALDLKLVDRIVDWSTYIEEMIGEGQASNAIKNDPESLTRTEKDMSTHSNQNAKCERVSATVEQLKSRFTKASNDFIVDQLMSQATLDEATTAYVRYLEGENAKLSNRLDALSQEEEDEPKEAKKTKRQAKKSKAEDDEDNPESEDDDTETEDDEEPKKSKSKSKSNDEEPESGDDEDDDPPKEKSKRSKSFGSLGTKPIPGGKRPGVTHGSAKEEWAAAIEDQMAKGKSKSDAVMWLVQNKKGLHERLLEEANQ